MDETPIERARRVLQQSQFHSDRNPDSHLARALSARTDWSGDNQPKSDAEWDEYQRSLDARDELRNG